MVTSNFVQCNKCIVIEVHKIVFNYFCIIFQTKLNLLNLIIGETKEEKVEKTNAQGHAL